MANELSDSSEIVRTPHPHATSVPSAARMRVVIRMREASSMCRGGRARRERAGPVRSVMMLLVGAVRDAEREVRVADGPGPRTLEEAAGEVEPCRRQAARIARRPDVVAVRNLF